MKRLIQIGSWAEVQISSNITFLSLTNEIAEKIYHPFANKVADAVNPEDHGVEPLGEGNVFDPNSSSIKKLVIWAYNGNKYAAIQPNKYED